MKGLIALISLFFIAEYSSAQYSWDAQVSATTNGIEDIYIAPTGNNKGIYCTSSGDIGRTNNGTDWVLVADILEVNGVSNSNWLRGIYIQDNLGDVAVTVASGGYFYRSIDSGVNWSLVHYTGIGADLHCLEYSNGRLFTASSSYMYFSDDVGLTWDSLAISASGSVPEISFKGDDGTFVTNNSVWHSDDLGATWAEITGLPHTNDIKSAVMVNSTTIFTVGVAGEIWSTTNLGATWNSSISNTTEDLHRIEFYNFNHGVTTGTNGIVLTTVDGGFGNWAVASHTASTSSTVAALHVQNETYAWFGNSSGEMFKSPSSTLALTILDIEHPDTICANSMLDYKIVFRVDAGVSVNQDFQFLLDGDNLHGSHVFYPGTIFAGDTGFFDLSVLVNNCDADGLILSAQAYNSASNIVAFYGLAQDDTLFCADPDPYTVSGPHEFCPGETISISASGGDSYNWITAVSNPLLPINGVSPAVPTNYLVQIQQEYCLISDTVFTYLGNDCEVVPPVDTVNVLLTAAAAYAFSPNGDSVNDFFLIDFLEDYPVNNVSIFNRWGDLVESFDNYDNQTVVWDGTYKGASVGAGTYYFIIEYGNGSSQTGWVQIVL